MQNSNYRTSNPISLNGALDMTICTYSLDGVNISCIDLVNCFNIHITQCELVNSDLLGINLTGCTNILIDNCSVANVSCVIHPLNEFNIQVKNDKIQQLGSKGMLVNLEHNGIERAEAINCMININT